MTLTLADIVQYVPQIGVAGLALLCVVAVIRGWVVPRYVHDQVVVWNDELLDFAGKSVVAFNRLASVSQHELTRATAERGEIKESIDEIRDQLGPVPGPSIPKKRASRYPPDGPGGRASPA